MPVRNSETAWFVMLPKRLNATRELPKQEMLKARRKIVARLFSF